MIRVSNLRKRFGATVALADVSVQFHPGEVHCVLGENGAGKSTLGKILGGLYKPDEGVVEIDGREQSIASPKEAHRLGLALCYQELSLARHLSVRANLCLGSESFRSSFAPIDKAAERAATAQVLAKLGLQLDMEQAAGDLPVAQQQLIEIGKALMLRPRAVVFDEPTAMLGAVEKQKFLDVLRQLRAEGVAAILITHHIEDVMAVSDRVTVMRNGRVVDSFAMSPEISSDDVVERLTGRRQDRAPASASAKAAHGEPVLEIDRIPWRGRASSPVRVHRGHIVSFYGVVGCGAEDIVQALAGQRPSPLLDLQLEQRRYRPASAAQALREGVAYLPAGRAANGILPSRSIVENLTLGSLSRHARHGVLSPGSEARHADAELRRAGVKFTDAASSITSLSGGNQQKVLMARALASATKLLILEEPTAGVDIEAKGEIHRQIRAAAHEGLTVVLLSSDLEEAISLSDVLFTMYRHEIVETYVNPDSSDQPGIISDVLGFEKSMSQLHGEPA